MYRRRCARWRTNRVPDVEIHLDMAAVKENKDNLIETACEMIESLGSVIGAR